MTKDKRRDKILEMLSKKGSVEVVELAKLFNRSEMSIRNDLNYLSDMGRLQRIYGGALSWSTGTLEVSLRDKLMRNLREKSMIGTAAADLVHEGDSIMLDSGTTTQQVAKNLSNTRNLTVITNGINIINTLAGIDEIALYTVGGQINARSFAIVGSDAERSLERYYAKLCVISVDGVDLERGLTNNSQSDANITRILLKQSGRKILVSDSSKFGKIALVPISPLADMDVLVTDDKAPATFVEAARDLGLEVIGARDAGV